MMGKVLLYGQTRGIANLKIVAIARILLLWMTLGDDKGVAAFNANFDPFRVFGPYGAGRVNRELERSEDFWLGSCSLTARCRVSCEACDTCSKKNIGDGTYQCSQVTPMPAPPPRNRCESTSCGRNAVCQNGICSCPPEMTGNPNENCHYPEGYCDFDTDCSDDKTCDKKTCSYVCSNACGSNAVCVAHDHKAHCSCPLEMTGNPNENCYYPEGYCNFDTDCSDDKTCDKKTCSYVCSNACGSNAVCEAHDHKANCSCLPEMIGDPKQNCHYPEGYCNVDTDCSLAEACTEKKCMHVCLNACGWGAACAAVNHTGQCTCPPGDTGNPEISCNGMIKIANFDLVPDELKTEDKPPLVFRSCDVVKFNADSFHEALEVSSAEGDQFMIDLISRCKFAERRLVTEQYRTAYGEELSDPWIRKFDSYKTNVNIITKHIFRDSIADSLRLYLSDLKGVWWQNEKSLKMIFFLLIESSDSDPISAALRNGTMYDTIKNRVIASSSPTDKLWPIFESQLNGTRSSDASEDERKARIQSSELLTAVTIMNFTGDKFRNIFMTTSYPQLRKVLEYYDGLGGGPPIEAKIRETFPALVAWAYNEILRYASSESSAKYFAERIREAGEGWWLVDILWRDEIDLDEIKRAYRTMYNVSLYDDKSRDNWNNDFEKNVWLAIVGE